MRRGQEECLSDAELIAVALGELARGHVVDALDHLDRCAACRERLSALAGESDRRTRPLSSPTPPSSVPPPIRPGTWIGNYRVDRLIGSGGMGVVYRGVEPSLARAVAIKLLNRPELDRPGERERTRMERESRALARLSHRNVVTIYQVGEHEGRRYLAMEYIEGGTVREWLAAGERSAREVVDLFVQAGDGLAAVHEAGFVHRDVKPDNLLVGSDGRVRVGDFGLVITAGDPGTEGPVERPPLAHGAVRLTETGALMGTPRYMAPEVLRGDSADARSDQWSYCASMWEALSGAPAYPGDIVTALDRGGAQQPPAEPDRPGRIPRRLRRALLRGLSHDPADRWPSMRSLVAELAGRRRITRATAAVLVAGVAGGVAIGLGFGGAGDEPDPCAAVGGELAGAWNQQRRAGLARALQPYPDSAASSIDRSAASYAGGWLEARRSACRTAAREATDAALEVACLDERRAAFAAVLSELGRAPPQDPVTALEAIDDLPATADCRDRTWLANRQPPPADPSRRARVAELRASLEAARVQLRFGRKDSADRMARSALEQARRLAPGTLTADSLWLVGQTARATGAPDARGKLEEGLTAAEAAADDVLVARLWADLLDAARTDETPRPEVDRWLRHARAIATRLDRLSPGAHDRTLADLAAAEGQLLRARGAALRAEARLRDALELDVRSGGTKSSRVVRARGRLAALLLERGQVQAAAAERGRAESLARELVGDADAPRLAAP